LKYKIKYHKSEIKREFCSLWVSELIWDFDHFGQIDFYINYSFFDCQEFQFEDLSNMQYEFLISHISTAVLALCQLIRVSRKIWFNFLTFLKIKNKFNKKIENNDEINHYGSFKNETSFDISSPSQSDNYSMNCSWKNVENSVNYNENQFLEEDKSKFFKFFKHKR